MATPMLVQKGGNLIPLATKWITKDRDVIEIAKMELSHVYFTARLIKQHLKGEKQVFENDHGGPFNPNLKDYLTGCFIRMFWRLEKEIDDLKTGNHLSISNKINLDNEWESMQNLYHNDISKQIVWEQETVVRRFNPDAPADSKDSTRGQLCHW